MSNQIVLNSSDEDFKLGDVVVVLDSNPSNGKLGVIRDVMTDSCLVLIDGESEPKFFKKYLVRKR